MDFKNTLYIYVVWTGNGFAILSDDSFIGGSLRFHFDKFPEYLARFDALDVADAVTRPDRTAPILFSINGASFAFGGFLGFAIPFRGLRWRRDDVE